MLRVDLSEEDPGEDVDLSPEGRRTSYVLVSQSDRFPSHRVVGSQGLSCLAYMIIQHQNFLLDSVEINLTKILHRHLDISLSLLLKNILHVTDLSIDVLCSRGHCLFELSENLNDLVHLLFLLRHASLFSCSDWG